MVSVLDMKIVYKKKKKKKAPQRLGAPNCAFRIIIPPFRLAAEDYFLGTG